MSDASEQHPLRRPPMERVVRRYDADQWEQAEIDALRDWLKLSPAERLIEADRIRWEHHGGVLPRLERTVRVVRPPWR